MRLTVVIYTFNEERRLARCIACVQGWATEVLVAGCYSTDATFEVASRHGARVILRPWVNHAAAWRGCFSTIRCGSFSLSRATEMSSGQRSSVTVPSFQHTGFTYRPDVDGLRAVAIIAVMLYHAGLPVTPGGYVGVDVFFVISGFVITSVVQADLARGRFTLLGFYERRVRRIFPALFTMIAVSLLIGWLVMMADDYKRLGQSASANALFLSNFYFMKDSGYFGVGAAAKPLLHTWSLAVEEQFYLLLPLYLLLLRRWTSASLRRVTLGIGVVSLVLALWATPLEPYASFFMLPTRAWELLVGVVLAQGLVPVPRSRWDTWLRVILGIGLILFAVLAYTDDTPFPGLAAVPPVLGTALLISIGAAGGGGDCLVGEPAHGIHGADLLSPLSLAFSAPWLLELSEPDGAECGADTGGEWGDRPLRGIVLAAYRAPRAGTASIEESALGVPVRCLLYLFDLGGWCGDSSQPGIRGALRWRTVADRAGDDRSHRRRK